MKHIGILLLATSVTLSLSACSKRSDDTASASGSAAQYGADGSSSSGASVGQTLSVRVITDRNNIATGGTDVANITALVTDADNLAVSDQEVSFRSTGGVLQAFSERTDENGQASATLVLAQDYQNQAIEVTVTAVESDVAYSGSVQVQTSGTEIDVAGPSALVLGDVAELTATLSAGNGEPIANHAVAISSSAGNTMTSVTGAALASGSTLMTDADGHVSVRIASDNGSDSIGFSALSSTASATYNLKVAEDILAFGDGVSGSEFQVGSVNDITVSWESNGTPVVGGSLRFAITAGQLLSSNVVTTDSQGQATATITSSSAGPVTVTVEAADDGDPATQTQVEFIATNPANVAIDTSSSRVPTLDTSTITALVTDANGNPVKNREVVFSSPNLKGGQLNPASAVTNSDGEAKVTFTAGSLATEFNEVAIVAEVEGTSISSQTNLTVVERVLNVTIGTSNFLEERANQTQYALPFVVQVADGGGTPLENAQVQMSIEPIAYYKGVMTLRDENGLTNTGSDPTWTAHHWSRSAIECEKEDDNGNRILDAGEDNNNNGSLDPQDPASLAPIESTEPLATLVGGVVTTDAKGSGYFDLIYPVSNAHWADVRITARAQALGAEAEASFRTGLLLLAEHSTKTTVSPPNHTSPYGTDFDCSNTD